MIILGVFLSLIIPLFFGYHLRKFLLGQGRESLALSLAVAYGLGMGFLSQWILLLGILKIPFSFAAIAWPLFGGGIVLKLINDHRRPALISTTKAPSVVADKVTVWTGY